MFFAKYAIDGKEKSELYINHEKFISDTFSPNTEIITLIDFTVHGRTYQEQKASVESIAIDWSNSGDVSGLYMSDLWVLSDWFYKNGKRYGLLKDFTENGLC